MGDGRWEMVWVGGVDGWSKEGSIAFIHFSVCGFRWGGLSTVIGEDGWVLCVKLTG